MTEELTVPVFVEFPSISRLSRDVVVTEKIDGTNASVTVLDDGRVLAGSRTRWITPADDNYGFAAWVAAHEEELRVGLGIGTHFGEWWGAGVQRKYGIDHKRFSLFNTSRWHSDQNADVAGIDPMQPSSVCREVACCHVVPVLLWWTFDTARIDGMLTRLGARGSYAAPGFMKPEGIVVFHVASNTLFKKTLDKNDGHKGVAR